MDDLSQYKTYKIGQAARLVDVKPFVLRFWEDEFEQLRPIRTQSGQRLYTDEHVALVRHIKHLLHERGMTIDGARRELAHPSSPPPDGQRSPNPLLLHIRDELLTLRELLR